LKDNSLIFRHLSFILFTTLKYFQKNRLKIARPRRFAIGALVVDYHIFDMM